MRILLMACVALLMGAGQVWAQTVLTVTTLQNELGAGGQTANVLVGDGTALSANEMIVVTDALTGAFEGMFINSISGDRLTVRRAYGTPSFAFGIGSTVYGGAVGSFNTSDVVPGADCSGAAVVPYINILNQSIFQCVGDKWARVTRSGEVATGSGPLVRAEAPTFVSSIVFEGATADASETTFSITDPTADRTFTFPDVASGAVMTSALTTNGADVANSVWGISNGLNFEGATADGFEATIAPADPVADSTATLPNLTGGIVVSGLTAGGSALTVTAVSHAGGCIALDTAAGTTITLPAATGTGDRYCFVTTTTATSNQHRIDVVGDDEFVGLIVLAQDGGDTALFFEALDTVDNDRIDMNGSTTGGIVGDILEIWDIAADTWHVEGHLSGTGTEVTPFATGAVS